MDVTLSNNIKLRDYQVSCVEKIVSILDFECPVKAYCFVLPTGAGKSVVIGASISEILKNYDTGNLHILVCSWSRKIVKQDLDKTAALSEGYDVRDMGNGKFSVETKAHINVVDFCTVQSLPNFNIGKTYDLIVVDECHKMYVGTAGYKEIVSRMHNSNGDLRNQNSDTVVLGFTATPYRNRHETVLSSEMFVPVEECVTYETLISRGYLVSPEYVKCSLFELDRDTLDVNSMGDFSSESMTKQCRKALNAIAETIIRAHSVRTGVRDACTLVFLPSLRICDEVLTTLKRLLKKYKLNFTVDIVKGETSEDDRDDIISRCNVVLNCGTLTTGVDITRVTTVIVCRATKSWTLWKQIVGRGLRAHNGKRRCFIIDCGGNVEQFGTDLDFMPSAGGVGATRLPIMSECPRCHHYVCATIKVCPACGTTLRTDEEIHAHKLQKIYLEGGLLPVESYSEKVVHIPKMGKRCVITVKFAYGRQRTFTFSEHPYSLQKYEEYSDVLKHANNKDELLFLKVESVKGFDTITDAKVLTRTHTAKETNDGKKKS